MALRFAVQRYETIPATERNGTELGNNSHSTTDDEMELDEVAISRLDEVQEEGEGLEDAPARRNSKFTDANNVVSRSAFVHSLSLPAMDGTTTPTTSDLSPSSLPVAEISGKVAKRGRLFASRQRRRLVFKDGVCNVSSGNVTKRKRKYLIDIFTTLVDMKWRYNLLMFSLAFVLSWVIFAVIWYVIAVAHGDHLHPSSDNDTWTACVDNVNDFVTALLFSIETQHTIGYGFRVMTPRCPEAVIFLMIQSCTGVFVQCLMTGLIFAKLSQPKRRSHTIMFSQKAVISQQDGAYCLLFRVGDMRRSHFVGTSIRALMVKDRLTKEGERIPLCQFPLDIQTEETSAGDNFVFLVWPVTVVHRINETSPLWNVSSEELLQERFEIIVILEGIVESTGMTTQVRTSYLPGEILWGHVLEPLVTYQKENGQYKIDYLRFHSVLPMRSMPECSARQLAEKGRSSDDLSPDGDFRAGYFTTPVGIKTGSNRLRMLRLMSGSLRTRKARRDKTKEKNDVKENSHHQQTAQL